MLSSSTPAFDLLTFWFPHLKSPFLVMAPKGDTLSSCAHPGQTAPILVSDDSPVPTNIMVSTVVCTT